MALDWSSIISGNEADITSQATQYAADNASEGSGVNWSLFNAGPGASWDSLSAQNNGGIPFSPQQSTSAWQTAKGYAPFDPKWQQSAANFSEGVPFAQSGDTQGWLNYYYGPRGSAWDTTSAGGKDYIVNPSGGPLVQSQNPLTAINRGPSGFGAALSDFSGLASTMNSNPAGKAIMFGLGGNLMDLWNGTGAASSLNMGGEDWEAFGGGENNSLFSPDADPGGFVNPATGRPGPGLPGGLDYGSGASLYPSKPLDYGTPSGGEPGASGFQDLLSKAASLWSGASAKGGPLANIGGSNGILPQINSALSIGSGLYGLYNNEMLRRKANAAPALMDPWGAGGGRGQANAQLMALMQDPGQVAAGDPSYKLRLQAAARAAAPYGEGSGKMAVDAANASTSWYNERLQQLGGLAGANIAPGGGVNTALTGGIAANKGAGDALASIGYGVNAGAGSTGGIPPQVLQWLMQMRTPQQ